MQMRAGGPARHADLSNNLTARDRVALRHQLLALMQVTGCDAMTVVKYGQAALQIELRTNERHACRRRGQDRRACGGGDVHTEMRFHRFAVQYALAAERAADNAMRRPVESFDKPVEIAVFRARRCDQGNFALPPLEHFRRQRNEFFRQARDRLHFVVPGDRKYVVRLSRSVGEMNVDPGCFRLVKGEAEREVSGRRDMYGRTIDGNARARSRLAHDEAALLEGPGKRETRGLRNRLPGENDGSQ